jgi:hypothetical protein
MSAVQNHLTQLAALENFPPNHIAYLWKLKNEGFEPKVIYDIGSCVLHWTKNAKRVWPDAKIILFDAFQSAEFLYGGYDYHVGVLSDEDDKTLRFYQNDFYPGGNSYYKENNDNVFPPDLYLEKVSKKLDTVVRERSFPPPDLIKIDVQGAEKDLIRGAVETLKHVQHLIVEMQCVNYNDKAPLVGETLPYIESLGFKCVAPKFSDNGPDADYGFVRSSSV